MNSSAKMASLPARHSNSSAWGRGEYVLKRLTTTNLVEWLLDCPEKGWFTTIESESTDSLLDHLDTLFDDSGSV
jgi:hypothetical protein